MPRKSILPITALAAITLLACQDDKKATEAPKPPPPTATSAAAPPPKKQGIMGNATIKGTVRFTGKAPEMKTPKARKAAERCSEKEIAHNAVLVKDGKLQDTFVRIAETSDLGEYKAPDAHVTVEQRDCVFIPRIQGAIAGQTIDVVNGDEVLHNIHTYKGGETWFNTSQPKGAAPISKPLEDTGIIKISCDVHPWMKSFVLVSSHPFFAVSNAEGAFTIEKVPAGKYEIDAWHAVYGPKKASLEVVEGKAAELTFTYDGSESAPPENAHELDDLF